MSLVCDETGRESDFGVPFFAGTRDDVPFFSALHPEVVTRIPPSQRRPTPCQTGDSGVDIHESSAAESLHGTYSSVGFELGTFLFSISHETAKKYLPKHLKRYELNVN